MDPTFALSVSQPSSFSPQIPLPQSITIPSSSPAAPSHSMDSRWPDLDFFELAPSRPLSPPSVTATSWVLPAPNSPVPPQTPPIIPSDDLSSISLIPPVNPPVNTSLLPTTHVPLPTILPDESTSTSTRPHSTISNLSALELRLGPSALYSSAPPLHHGDQSPHSVLPHSSTTRQPAKLTKSRLFCQNLYPSSRPRIQKQTRRYTSPKSSRYCHLCARHQRSVPMVPCGNVQLGLCQKSVCTKCIATYNLDVRVPNWACPHCCNSCPQRAKCFSYDRQTARRREKTMMAKLRAVICSNSSTIPPSHCAVQTPTHIVHTAWSI